jgi:hypothetical protein
MHCWHVPERQQGRPSSGQLQAFPSRGTFAVAAEKAAPYCAAAFVLIVPVSQKEQSFAGHESTWPTLTQLASTVHDRS